MNSVSDRATAGDAGLHQEAARRLKQMLLEALPGLAVDASHQLDIRIAAEALGLAAAFIQKDLSEWVEHDTLALTALFLTIHKAVVDRRLGVTPGLLRDIASDQQRHAIADAALAFWSTVPVTYEFEFSLPGLAPVANPIEIAPGVILDKRERLANPPAQRGLRVP